MKSDQQPFEVRSEVNKPQVPAIRDPLWIAAGGAVLSDPVSIEQNKSPLVPFTGNVSASPLADGVFDYPSGISTAGHDDIKMKMESLVFAQFAQPARKCAVAVALRRDEDALASQDKPAPGHESTERRQPAKRAAAVEFAKIAAPSHPLDVAYAVRLGEALAILIDDEHLFLLETVEDR